MIVKFMTFNKKYNSTLRPSNDLGTSYDCILKTSSSVISPTIELNIGLVVNPSAFNYAYIPDYNRYYWVSEWTFVQTYWVASLSVDVLASWRPYIGDFNMYVYRASAEYNTGIVDTAYPTSNVSTAIVYEENPTSKPLDQGYYIVSVYGGNSDSTVDNVRYYVFNSEEFTVFMQRLYANLNDNNLWQTVVTGIRNAIFDISNYIKQCWWCPYDPGEGETIVEMPVGNWLITRITCRRLKVTNEGYCVRFSKRFSIPKHPQQITRGNYLNLSPHSKYNLIFFPWGEIEISPSLLNGKDWLGVEVSVDGITGQGLLRVYSYNYNQFDQPYDIWDICTQMCQYLVPIPITFSNADVFGAVQNFQYESINRTYANKNATPYLTASHYIVATADLFFPTLSTNGKGGSTMQINYARNHLQAIFFELVDEDLYSIGRPLCEIRKPMNIEGYIEGDSSDFSAPATDTEITMIKDFIDRGFYYE